MKKTLVSFLLVTVAVFGYHKFNSQTAITESNSLVLVNVEALSYDEMPGWYVDEIIKVYDQDFGDEDYFECCTYTRVECFKNGGLSKSCTSNESTVCEYLLTKDKAQHELEVEHDDD